MSKQHTDSVVLRSSTAISVGSDDSTNPVTSQAPTLPKNCGTCKHFHDLTAETNWHCVIGECEAPNSDNVIDIRSFSFMYGTEGKNCPCHLSGSQSVDLGLPTSTDYLESRIRELEAEVERLAKVNDAAYGADQVELSAIDELQEQLDAVEDALINAGYWGHVDVEVQTFAESIELMAQNLATRDRQLAAAREALKVVSRNLSHREDVAEVCYDWCPRCIVDTALSALDGEVR